MTSFFRGIPLLVLSLSVAFGCDKESGTRAVNSHPSTTQAAQATRPPSSTVAPDAGPRAWTDGLLRALRADDFDALYDQDQGVRQREASVRSSEPAFAVGKILRARREAAKKKFFTDNNAEFEGDLYTDRATLAALVYSDPKTEFLETKNDGSLIHAYVRFTFASYESAPLVRRENEPVDVIRERVAILTFTPSGTFVGYKAMPDHDEVFKSVPHRLVAVEFDFVGGNMKAYSLGSPINRMSGEVTIGGNVGKKIAMQRFTDNTLNVLGSEFDLPAPFLVRIETTCDGFRDRSSFIRRERYQSEIFLSPGFARNRWERAYTLSELGSTAKAVSPLPEESSVATKPANESPRPR